MKEKSGKEGSYRYILFAILLTAALGVVPVLTSSVGQGHYAFFLLLMVVSWGIVPGLAKKGGLPGDLMTFWVNWFSLPTLAYLVTIENSWGLLLSYDLGDYKTMVALGVIWPLANSIAYFQCVKVAGGALTTILNYTWPVFFLAFAYLISGAQASWLSVASVALAIAAVVVTRLLGRREQEQGVERNNTSKSLGIPFVVLGLVAAITQGFYSAATDRWSYDPLAMTFVVEVVTAVGVTIFIAILRRKFTLPSARALFYAYVIGALSNGIGFWAFLAGSQVSGKLGVVDKCTWLVGMCTVPLAQVILLPILGAERVERRKWVGVGIITASFILNRLGSVLV